MVCCVFVTPVLGQWMKSSKCANIGMVILMIFANMMINVHCPNLINKYMKVKKVILSFVL